MTNLRPDININPSGTGGGNTGGVSILGVYYSTAPNDGVTNAEPQLRSEIQYCINNGIRVLELSNGTYRVDDPLFLYFFYAGNYVGFGLELRGQGSMWDIKTTIQATFSDRFILGIQHGKGVTIKGIRIRGMFTPPEGDDYGYFNRSFDDFTDGISRDSQYSPNCAIAIDPVTNTTGVIPADGGYPNMSSYYQGTASSVGTIQAGSTATFITDCILEKTVVGVCSSPNGYTRNAELTAIENVQFRFNKLCVSGGQEQEKQNTIRNCACWYDSHTFFATGKYGAGSPGNWNIDGVNIAGRVVQFTDNDQNGYFPSYIKNVYAERLGKFGLITNFAGRLASKVENCDISFTNFSDAGIPVSLINAGNNVLFLSCTFRYYGAMGFPMLLQGNGTYKNCSFSGFPVFQGNYNYSRFIDCFANGSHLGLTGIKTIGTETYHPYGNWEIMDYGALWQIEGGIPPNTRTKIKSSSQEIYTTFTQDTNVSVTITSNSFTFTSTNGAAYILGGMVEVSTGKFGQVTNISSNTITVSYLPFGMINGTYNIAAFYPILSTGPIIGDITSGSNTILNVSGGLNANQVIKNPYGGSKYIKILSVTGTTVVFYGSITTTKTGAIFGNYTSMEFYTEYPGIDALSAGALVRRGDKVTSQKGSENSTEYIITKGGFLGGTDIRQAIPQIAY